MSEKVIDINKPVIKNASGILVDPDVIKKEQKTKMDLELDNYNKRYTKNYNVSTPDIAVPYSYILTTATPPKMTGYSESGLIINKLEVDVRLANKLKIMSENVSDEQRVLSIGPFVTDGLKVKPGDMVKINFERYRTIHDNHTPGVIETQYDIPLFVIEDNEYLMIDARDVYYSFKNKDEQWY